MRYGDDAFNRTRSFAYEWRRPLGWLGGGFGVLLTGMVTKWIGWPEVSRGHFTQYFRDPSASTPVLGLTPLRDGERLVIRVRSLGRRDNNPVVNGRYLVRVSLNYYHWRRFANGQGEGTPTRLIIAESETLTLPAGPGDRVIAGMEYSLSAAQIEEAFRSCGGDAEGAALNVELVQISTSFGWVSQRARFSPDPNRRPDLDGPWMIPVVGIRNPMIMGERQVAPTIDELRNQNGPNPLGIWTQGGAAQIEFQVVR